ncbi:MAG: NAD(P)-dependent alcohol dehydrogenase [Gammaproteobacteria bacterium]|nr:NAD(P)-dependent alcohol dehydrogenase [Gammaproteobacteria bacterium]
MNNGIVTKAYAAPTAKQPLAPYSFEHRELRDEDVLIDIDYCGVCHSDIHQVRNEWGEGFFPMVPGHEIVGHISRVGPKVQAFKVGDLVGVGCMVDSCRTCNACEQDLEQYCEKGFTGTYNSMDRKTKAPTRGGYADKIVVDQSFVLRVPANLPLSAVAPLLCAGITTYSPLHHWKVGPGQKVGIVGLGGLGHMGVKFAHAMGAHTVVLTHSANKRDDALRLGANEILVSSDPAEMNKHKGSFDLLLSTISAPYDINQYLDLLTLNGTMVVVGVPENALPLNAFQLIGKRRRLAGSLIGGIAETQAMLDYCGKHNITSDVEIIPIQKINEAYERMLKSDVRYRFVINMKSLAL